MPYKKIKACLLIFFSLTSCILFTQEKVNAQESFENTPTRLLTEFPFTMLSGGIIILHATVADLPDTLNFILDTGSGGISLDSSTVDYFKLPVTPSNRTIRGIAGIRKVSFVMGQTLHLPGLSVHSLDFHINDYDILTSVYGVKIDGIIGFSFLRRYIVKLNYDNQTLEVWSQGKIQYPRNGFMLKPKLNGIPVIPATLREARKANSRFFFDTGAGLCFLITEEFLRDSAILKKGKKIINTQGEGLGGKKLMRLTTVREVKIGPYRFRHVPAHLFDDEFNLTAYPELGGIVGNDLLRRFNLVINYEQNEIYLSPNTHYFEPFDYSYTGLGIYLIDGEIVVEDVIEDSPGEKAGLLPGDVIISVGNNFSGNIQQYKHLLQVPNTRLKIIIRRGDELKQIMLYVQSIL